MTKTTELGVEKLCPACREWWPLDEEFYYRQRNGHLGYTSRCRACWLEAYRPDSKPRVVLTDEERRERHREAERRRWHALTPEQRRAKVDEAVERRRRRKAAARAAA